MSDLSRGAPETETPVNPYSLLEAVNDSSETAHTGWLIFLGIMTYLMIAVAGVTHRDLLLETPVALPILQVEIQITQFFQFAAIVLVLFHLGLVSQLVLLARKTLEFDHAIRLLEATHRRTHPLRLELHNFFFVQAVAGPHRSYVMSGFLHAMSWLTLVILPVVLILYIQIVFLPYHNVDITWMHRVALLTDIGMLILIGVFLMRAEASFFQAFWKTTISHPISFTLTAVVLAFVTLFSLFGATVPGEFLDRAGQTLFGAQTANANAGGGPRYASGFTMAIFGAREDGTMFGLFRKNIVVTDTDLVVDKDVTPGEVTRSFRGRDLRNAKLDRSDLHQADFTGANLDDATLIGADLRDAQLGCAEIDFKKILLLSENRKAAGCTSARRADLSEANLSGARMAGVDFSRARLNSARLEGAELPYAALTGADMTSVDLDKADMTGGVLAMNTSFLGALLRGADLTGAQLQGADFSSAEMQGAVFSHAHLEGASLRSASLEAAALGQTFLQRADVSGANLTGADLRGAAIWDTLPPATPAPALADFSDLRIEPLTEEQIATLNHAIGKIEDDRDRQEVTDAIAPLLAGDRGQLWDTDYQPLWQTLAASPQPVNPDSYKVEITDYLSKFMCKARWNGGAVATGVARRALAPQFRGDFLALYDRLKSDDCWASRTVSPRALKELSDKVNIARE